MSYKKWIKKIEKCGENIDHELISKLSLREIEKLAKGFKYFGIKTQESIDNLLLIAHNYSNLYGKRFLDEFVRNIRPYRED